MTMKKEEGQLRPATIEEGTKKDGQKQVESLDAKSEEDPILAEAEKNGVKVRRRNAMISVVCGVLFIAFLVWGSKSGAFANTKEIQGFLEKAGVFAPILFILISVFSSYIPIVPMGSMGSIGIVLFGAQTAFFYNYAASVINCLLGYWLATRYGERIILQFASPAQYKKYLAMLQKSKHFELFFAFCMMLPVSPDILLCMIAGLLHVNWKHFVAIILISRPFSSWAYSTGLLKIFEWIKGMLHL